MVGSNLYGFSKLIFPYIKHPQKINDFNLIFKKKGKLNNRFLYILDIINENPGKTNKELSKALKRVKIYSQINFLKDSGYIRKINYPHRIYITNKGLASLSQGGKDK